jgi:hypothetical protein
MISVVAGNGSRTIGFPGFMQKICSGLFHRHIEVTRTVMPRFALSGRRLRSIDTAALMVFDEAYCFGCGSGAFLFPGSKKGSPRL